MKNDKMRSALDQELHGVRVNEILKRRIIAAAEEEKRRRQRRRTLRMLSGLAAALVIMLGVSAFMLGQRPVIPDVQKHPLTHGMPSTDEPPAPGPDPAYTAAPMDGTETTPEPTPRIPVLLHEQMVWATEKGHYYHSEKNCSGMKDAENIPIKTAMERGQGACPMCRPPVYMPDAGETTPEPTLTPMPEPADTMPVLVWATKEGAYYHAEEHCSGMRNAGQITLETTVLWNKKACPICRPPETESEEGFGFREAMGDIESLMAWQYCGNALITEYSFERNACLINELTDPEEWYAGEIDEDTFNMRNATWHMLSDEDHKLLEEAYFMNFEAGFAQNDIMLISEDIVTQNMSSDEKLPAGTEYHFCSPDEPADRIIFYDMDEGSAWTEDHMLMTRFTRLRMWYFDGKKVYEKAQTLDTPQSLRVPVHDGGEISGHTTEVDVQGHKIKVRLWQTEDMYILILVPEEGVQLNPDATGWTDENGEGMRPYMALDTSTCNEGMLGWIFRGDIPMDGATLCLSMESGEKATIGLEKLMAGASQDGETIPEGVHIAAYSGCIPEGGILMLDYQYDVERLGHDVKISLQDRAGSEHAFSDGSAYKFTYFESGHEALVYLTDWHYADETVSVIVSGIPGKGDIVVGIPVEQAENSGSAVDVYQKIKVDASVRQDFYMIGEYQIAILETISKDKAVVLKGVESLFMDNWESDEPMGMVKSGNENPGVTGWMVKNADKGFSLKSIDPDFGWEDVYVYLPSIIETVESE